MNNSSEIDLKAIASQAMANFGFIPQFPPGVLREAQAFNSEININNSASPIHDLRDLLWSSIDNIDSRDLDQIEYCERGQSREIRVLIGVADVD